MAVPRGRTYPFPERSSPIWIGLHVTYDQAVDMFYNQTATQQFMGHDPVIYSKVYKRITYPTIEEAQQAHTEQSITRYRTAEQRDLDCESRGVSAFKNSNDAIRNRINPTEDGLESVMSRPLTPIGSSSSSVLSSLSSVTQSSATQTAQPIQSAVQASATPTPSVIPTTTAPSSLIGVIPEEEEDNDAFMLGWCQVERTQSKDLMFESLFTDQTSKAQRTLIKQHNFHLNSMVREGEIVVIPTTKAITEKDKKAVADLQEEAKAASIELAKLSPEEVVTANRHFELFDYQMCEIEKTKGLPPEYLAYASMGVGAVAAGVGKHLSNISNILEEVNSLYVSQVAMASRTGGMNYGVFVAERAALLSKLDGSFAMLSKRTIAIPAYVQVRKALKLHTKSIIHNADEIIKSGWVPNLGKRIAKIAIAMKGMKSIGYVGLGLAAASSVDNIYDACSVDGTGECGKTVTKEVVGFIGGLVGGSYGGTAAVVLVLGVVGTASAPVIAVATVGAFVVGGAVGGTYGGKGASAFVDFIYELVE